MMKKSNENFMILNAIYIEEKPPEMLGLLQYIVKK